MKILHIILAMSTLMLEPCFSQTVQVASENPNTNDVIISKPADLSDARAVLEGLVPSSRGGNDDVMLIMHPDGTVHIRILLKDGSNIGATDKDLISTVKRLVEKLDQKHIAAEFAKAQESKPKIDPGMEAKAASDAAKVILEKIAQ